MVFLKEFFKKVNLEKKSADDKKIQIRPDKNMGRNCLQKLLADDTGR